MKRILLINLILIIVAGCSHIPTLDNVLSDKRTDYKKSEALPDLEVPPDLTAASENASMSIPGEGQATLSEYKKEQSQRRGQVQNRGQEQVGTQPAAQAPQYAQASVPAPQQEPAGAADNQWVAVQGTTAEVWPQLRSYLAGKGYTFDLDDAELGVLDTNWSAPSSGDGTVSRSRYKFFSDTGGAPGTTVIYVSCVRQGMDGNTWQDLDEDVMAGRVMVADLNRYFNNSNMPVTPAVSQYTTVQRQQARIEDGGDGKLILVLPDEFTYAWKQAGSALQQSGLLINNMDQDRGTYTVSYADSQPRRKKGWLSKLAFWKGDDDSRAKVYQVSLTGMGRKTELIVLDESGNWRNDPQANDLLRMIGNRYNSL